MVSFHALLAVPDSPTLKLTSILGSERTFTASWESPDDSIDHYSAAVFGEFCGVCNMSKNNSELSCSGWEPIGQVCSVTVVAVEAICGFQQLNSLPVYLKCESELNTIWYSFLTYYSLRSQNT